MSDLSEVLTAIGTLDGKVDGLCGTVEGQGEKLDEVRNAVASIKPVCEAHQRALDGYAKTLFGTEGSTGIVKQIAVNTGRIESLETNKRERGEIFWRIAVQVLVFVIMAVIVFGLALWKRQ